MVHVRAAIGSPIQETNCHPFRHGKWLFVHNGYINEFPTLRRDLMLAIDPQRFAAVHGSTDTEVVFQLALTFGLEDDPIAAIARTVGFIETTADAHGVEGAVQGTFGASDGTHLWAVRYATEGPPRSLYASADAKTVRRLHPENERFKQLSDDDRLVVSEPFSDLPGIWREIPGSTAVTVGHGGLFSEQPFTPAAP
jgi:glutamine amidotransferase